MFSQCWKILLNVHIQNHQFCQEHFTIYDRFVIAQIIYSEKRINKLTLLEHQFEVQSENGHNVYVVDFTIPSCTYMFRFSKVSLAMQTYMCIVHICSMYQVIHLMIYLINLKIMFTYIYRPYRYSITSPQE